MTQVCENCGRVWTMTTFEDSSQGRCRRCRGVRSIQRSRRGLAGNVVRLVDYECLGCGRRHDAHADAVACDASHHRT